MLRGEGQRPKRRGDQSRDTKEGGLGGLAGLRGGRRTAEPEGEPGELSARRRPAGAGRERGARGPAAAAAAAGRGVRAGLRRCPG